MKVWLVFSAVLVATCAYRNNVAIQGRTSTGIKMVDNFINQMPCGWPEIGIPPLAPYVKKELRWYRKNSFNEILINLENFRIDGLDIMLIEKLRVSYLRHYWKFNVTFPKIVFSGKYLTYVFAKEDAFGTRYYAKGDFEFILENLNFQGYFKYEMPTLPLIRSARIYNFDGSLTLGNVVSRIGGIMGNGIINRWINDKIKETLLTFINSNREWVSTELKQKLVPLVNEKLEGKNVSTFLQSLFGQKDKICYPSPIPRRNLSDHIKK